MILIFLAAAAASPDSGKLRGLAQDQCRLAESMALDPPPGCIKRHSQFDMNVCSFRDYLHADIKLNQTWGAVTKRLAGSQKVLASLLSGQRAWLTYRDKQCDLWAKWYEGGTVAALMINSCATDITKFRTKELGQLLEDN